jgi:hypothetical protein
MFKKKKYILSIKEPCSQKWEEMHTTSLGQFCSHCKKNVIDFSHLNDEQIVAYFQNKKDQVCGKFHEHQLNRVISNSKPQQGNSRFLAFLGGLLLFNHTNHAMAQIKTTDVHIDAATKNPIANFNKQDTVYKEKIVLQGTVYDKQHDETIPFVMVYLKNHDIATACNAEGQFKLEIPGNFIDDTIVLIFQFVGYESTEITYYREERATNKTIPMIPTMRNLIGEVTIYKEKKWWQRK